MNRLLIHHWDILVAGKMQIHGSRPDGSPELTVDCFIGIDDKFGKDICQEAFSGIVFQPFSKKPDHKQAVEICSTVLISILLYDKICISMPFVDRMISLFGIDAVILLLDKGILEIFSDEGHQVGVYHYRDKGIAAIVPFGISIAGDFSFIADAMRKHTSLARSKIDRLEFLVSHNLRYIDSRSIQTNIVKEVDYDLQNNQIRKLLNMESQRHDEIMAQDIHKAIRLSHINKVLILSFELNCNSIITDGRAGTILEAKMAPILNKSISDTPIQLFRDIMALKGIPDLGQLYINGTITLESIIELRDNVDGMLFRKWFEDTDYDPKKVIRILLNKQKTIGSHLLARSVRFAYPKIIALVSPLGGLVTSFADSFIIEKILNGWNPSLFLDDKLMKRLDKQIKQFEKKCMTNQVNKFFPFTHPDDPCPCGSNKKYKRCCDRS